MDQSKGILEATAEDEKTTKKFYQEMKEKKKISPETEKELDALLAKIPNCKEKKFLGAFKKSKNAEKLDRDEEELYKEDDEASTSQSIDNNLDLVNKGDARNFTGAEIVTVFGMLLLFAFGWNFVKTYDDNADLSYTHPLLGTVKAKGKSKAATQANGTPVPQQNGLEEVVIDRPMEENH